LRGRCVGEGEEVALSWCWWVVGPGGFGEFRWGFLVRRGCFSVGFGAFEM